MNPRTLLFAALGLFGLWSCDASKTVAVGGGDETHSNIDIQGAVFTNRSEPFAGIVVKLRGLGIADTTDSHGAFRIHRADTTFVTKSGAVDTLDYLREGRIVHSQAVPSWVATLPDLFLVQRDISGKLTGAVDAVKSVEAIFGTDRSDTLALEWNPVLGSYSGFAYAPWDGTGTVTHYQVRIEVRDSLHHLIGRSFDIPFTSRAGDLDVPVFSAGNAKPYLKIVGKDSAASREFLELRAVVADSFGQKVTLRWREAGSELLHHVVDTVNGTRYFQTSSDTTVRIAMPGGRDSTYTIHCTATDEEGIVVQDSLVVHRRFTIPFAQFSFSLNGDSVHLHMETSVKNKGRLLERRLFLGTDIETGIRFDCWRGERTGGVESFQNGASWSVSEGLAYSRLGWSDRRYIPGSPITIQRISSDFSISYGGGCVDTNGWNESRFIKRDSGVLVSGRDTTFLLPPRDPQGSPFQFALQLLDEDGQIGVWRSEPFTKLFAPKSMGLSIVFPDTSNDTASSIQIRWQAPDSTALNAQTVWGNSFGSWEVVWDALDGTNPRVQNFTKWTDSVATFPVDEVGGCATVRQRSGQLYSKPVTNCIFTM